MSTTPHHDDDNNHDRHHADDERAAIEEAAAQLRVPVATLRYWRTHRRLRRTQPGRRPGSGSTGV
ncbi:hypothetical protein D0Z08_15170 [Nocardioides immobilis]|uniref:MerR family transcriptional regulator n=1 Tax=Nocardioides immobilis TaxID=2049295 RepID=A0A417Y0X5_9ACTN|nr:hypothetical protein [Nocardioides immobilis]RHW26299.1 hypothetical protein D0Z08_15170 [Nocardioides immobilis]